jgi:NAD/NADP transhydrogenase beta subunit
MVNAPMPPLSKPNVLPPETRFLRPRTRRVQSWFADENLDLLSHLLDDWFRLPGTSIRFGLDGIIGLIPGLGDILAGLASCIIVIAAWFRGVPYVALIRMVVNLAIDVLIGAIPFIGDAFDIAFKANRRNYALMMRHLRQPRIHTWKDYVFLACIAAILFAIFAIPVVVLVWVANWLLQQQ